MLPRCVLSCRMFIFKTSLFFWIKKKKKCTQGIVLGKYWLVLFIFIFLSLLNFSASCMLIYQKNLLKSFLIFNQSVTPFFSKSKFKLLSLSIEAFHHLAPPHNSLLTSFKGDWCSLAPSQSIVLFPPLIILSSWNDGMLFSILPVKASQFQLQESSSFQKNLPHPPPPSYSCLVLPWILWTLVFITRWMLFLCCLHCSLYACIQWWKWS